MSGMLKLLNLLKIGIFLILEAPFRPRWVYYRLRGYAFLHVLNRKHQDHTSEYASHIRPLHEALSYITGKSVEEFTAARESELIRNMSVEDIWVVGVSGKSDTSDCSGKTGGPIPICYGPSPELIEVVYTVCAILKPDSVIETGVARGFTSTAILTALEENGKGRLHSVEMPSLYIGYAKQVGELIPEKLRDRWSLSLGPSAVVMPRLMKEIKDLDVFVHDSASNYDNQMTEYRIALSGMKPGSVLISDMLNNDAFYETVESVNCRWAVIRQSKHFPIGVLCLVE